MEILRLELGETICGLPFDRVIEVAPRVAVTPLPELPAAVAGYLAYRGRPLVAVDLRARLGLPRRPPALTDHFVICRLARRRAALIVDRALGLDRVDDRVIEPPLAEATHIEGVVTGPEGVLLIADLDAMLSLDEERALEHALPAEVT